ncbi:bacteriophage CII family protein [Glaesserella parasuis 12939]|nr:bacteriophage CII family protein [Glaesserella parasuis 12939]MDE4032471.1 CII family transcriptional regulator [Glaesserella parasuis]MDO9888028.1 CII family transcriptional regulator [Glaesserella parasuis]
MARNELSKNARAIADLIYRKSASRTHKDLASKIGVSESQFSRVFLQYVEWYAVICDELELEIELIDEKELAAYKTLARKSLDE